MKKFLCRILGHQFGEWEYAAEDSCEQVRTCRRDGYQEKREVAHQFGEWEYISKQCKKRRKCTHCKKIEITSTSSQHQWSDWIQIKKCVQERTCKYCQKREQQFTHDWGPEICLYGGFSDPGNSTPAPPIYARECTKCGEYDEPVEKWG